jgi:hypothetical protein
MVACMALFFFRLDGVMLMAWVVVIIAKEKREKIH